jgi:chaperonin GroEL
MSVKRVKSAPKVFTSNLSELQNIIIKTMDRISGIVGNSLGPGGRCVLIESELPDIPHKNTKDGVSIFRALGASNAIEHLIIEQTRDAAIRTVNEAGDGTTSSTIISAELIKNLFAFCNNNRKYSPQRVTRIIQKHLNDTLIPYIDKTAIKINNKNKHLLEKVAAISANGDKDMAKAVMKAFEEVGYGASSHVTIQELSGPSGNYDVNVIEGFPINKGYEESIGKFHAMFINDQAHQRCVLEKPLFILFDGNITDLLQIEQLLTDIGELYANGSHEYKNVVVVAHRFADEVLNTLAVNFANPLTINIVPLTTPMDGLINSQLNFLMDLSAFTGAKIWDMNDPLSNATVLSIQNGELGANMDKIEIYRFRSTVVGEPDATNIEVRADDLREQIKQASSKYEKMILEERLGKLTAGIAQLKIYGATNGELKEKADRAEDAVCAVRAAINYGCLPGGCRTLLNMISELIKTHKEDAIVMEVLIPSLFSPFYRLLENAGYNEEEIQSTLKHLTENPDHVFDVENGVFGTADKLGVFDAALAVKQALINAVSIASVMGTLGGLVVNPRDHELERENARDYSNFMRTLENAENIKNEANSRP